MTAVGGCIIACFMAGSTSILSVLTGKTVDKTVEKLWILKHNILCPSPRSYADERRLSTLHYIYYYSTNTVSYEFPYGYLHDHAGNKRFPTSCMRRAARALNCGRSP